jgi:hypothetical protein
MLMHSDDHHLHPRQPRELIDGQPLPWPEIAATGWTICSGLKIGNW